MKNKVAKNLPPILPRNEITPVNTRVIVPTTGVEPARSYKHYPLKVARLPIPPRGLTFVYSKSK
tara:strand:- start:1138 stop:1329 length:192 start_codon:yes stop_codon:yes gene_type:complete